MLTVMIQTIEEGGGPDRSELEALLLRVAAGDQDAFAGLYHRTRAAVYALALSILKNAHDAQDITQDAFVRIWENAPEYRPQGSPMAWILTITRNLARMQLRRSARHTDLDEAEWNAIPADLPAVTPEDRHLLQTALAALSDEERKVILLHAVSGLKHREIAAVLELPLPTVLSKYHRALKKLRAFVKGDDSL